MKSLYNITTEFLEIETKLIESEGEITEEIKELLKINKDEIEIKSGSYVSVINRENTDITFIDAEIKRLQDIKKYKKNLIQRLKSNILDAMIIYGIDEIKTPLNTIKTRKSESIEISIPVDELANKLIKIKKEVINKNEIKKMLKNGETFNGVKLIENKNLNIK